MGKTKDSIEIDYMSKKILDYDIIAIQEISTSHYGEDAIVNLINSLEFNSKFNWKYVLSEKTSGSGTEKYAFIYKADIIKILYDPTLAKNVEMEISREPYLSTFFNNKGDTVTLVNFHAIPNSRDKDPRTEIVLLDKIYEEYNSYPMVFMGDFNLKESDNAYDNLKNIGFKSSLKDKKTSLKTKCKDGNCMSHEYDNFYYDSNFLELNNSYVLYFFKDFNDIIEARKISDHCPIVIILKSKDI